MTRDKVVTLIAMLASILVTNAGQYALQEYRISGMKQSYEQQLKVASATAEALGPMVNCLTVKKDLVGAVGLPIEAKDLDVLPMPEKYVSNLFPRNKDELIGKYWKIDMHPGTPITTDDIMEEKKDDTDRETDVSLSGLPSGLAVGDYVDVRIMYPKGEDFIVLTHKRVQSINQTVVKIITTERERHFLAGALIDQFINSAYGASLYGSKYTDPGIQKEAIVYYNVPANIMTVIASNPNIVDKVLDSSVSRAMIDNATSNIPSKLGDVLGQGKQNYQSKLDQARDYYNQQSKKAGLYGTAGTQDANSQAPAATQDATQQNQQAASGGIPKDSEATKTTASQPASQK